MAVQYEALVAGLGQREQYNIGSYADQIYRQLSELGAGPVTTLRLVLDMLFPDAAGRQAAAAIEQCVLVSSACGCTYFQDACVGAGTASMCNASGKDPSSAA